MYTKIDVANIESDETSQEEELSVDSEGLVEQGACLTKLQSEVSTKVLTIGTRGLGPCIAIIASGVQYNKENQTDQFISLYHWESLIIDEAIPFTQETCLAALRKDLIEKFFKEVLVNKEGEDPTKVKITDIVLVGGQKGYQKNGEVILTGTELEALVFKKIFGEKDELEKLKAEIETNFETTIDFFELKLSTNHLLVVEGDESLNLEAYFDTENKQLTLEVTKVAMTPHITPQNSPQKLISLLGTPQETHSAAKCLVMPEPSTLESKKIEITSIKEKITPQFFKRSFDVYQEDCLSTQSNKKSKNSELSSTPIFNN